MIGIALLSGGLDSGVAAARFVAEDGNELRAALFCDYGHRASGRELAAAKGLAARRAHQLAGGRVQVRGVV